MRHSHWLMRWLTVEAHLHIARRLFDSHRPWITQLGNEWLPLPHLLMLPFVAVDSWWRSGFAGAIPSGLEFLLAAVGLYRLARRWMSVAAALFALIPSAANPTTLFEYDGDDRAAVFGRAHLGGLAAGGVARFA